MATLAGYSGMARLVIVGEQHGQETNNVLWFGLFGQVNAPNYNALLTALAAAMLQCIVTTLLPFASAEWIPVKIKAKMFDPVNTDEVEVAFAGQVGAVAGDALPTYVAAVCSIRTGLGGRSKRGRFYVPGVPESGQALSKLTAPQLALLIAYVTCVITTFIQNVSAGEWRLGVFSRRLGYTQATKVYDMSAGWVPATDVLARQNLGSANSRKLHRGV